MVFRVQAKREDGREGRVLLVGGSLSLNSHLAKKVLNNDFQMLRTHIPPLVPKVQRFLMIGLIRY